MDLGKIGDKEIVFRETFIMQKNEMLEFSFSPNYPEPSPIATYNKWTVNVKVAISRSEDDEIKAEWGKDNNKPFVKITLPAVASRMGPGITTEPIKIGEVFGKKLGFLAAYSPSPGGSALVTLQFTLGGNYE